jgi:hypothetical protein
MLGHEHCEKRKKSGRHVNFTIQTVDHSRGLPYGANPNWLGPVSGMVSDDDGEATSADQLGPPWADRLLGRNGDLIVYERNEQGKLRLWQKFSPEIEDADLAEVKLAITEARRAFFEQATSLKELDHPNILPVLARLFLQGAAWRVQSPPGGQLEGELVAEAPFAPPKTLRLARDLAAGLKAAHEAGVTHLDLSPDAVCVPDVKGKVGENLHKANGAGNYRLWGFTVDRRALRRHVPNPRAMIRPGYSAIELYDPSGRELLGPHTDIYALGALLHRLITGVPPKESTLRTNNEIVWPEAARSAYTAGFLKSVEAALAVEPEERIADLDQIVAQAMPPAPTAKKPSLLKSVYKIAVSVCLGAIALIVLIGLFGIFYHKPVEVLAPEGCTWAKSDPNTSTSSLICGPDQVVVSGHGLQPSDVRDAANGDQASMKRLLAFYRTPGPGQNVEEADSLLYGLADAGDAASILEHAAFLADPPADAPVAPVAVAYGDKNTVFSIQAKNRAEAAHWYRVVVDPTTLAPGYDQPIPNLSPTEDQKREARKSLLALEPQLWSSGWHPKGEKGCNVKLNLTGQSLNFVGQDYTLAAAVKRREPGLIEAYVNETGALLLLKLTPPADTMTLSLDDAAPSTFVKCDAAVQ